MGSTLLWMVLLLFVTCHGKFAWLHLRVLPQPVFEGDTLTLKCEGKENKAVSQVKFYKDGKVLDSFKTNKPLPMGTATMTSSGQYSCTGKVFGMPEPTQTSERTTVQVQEWFQTPVLSTIPSLELHEGSHLTLRCETKTHLQKSASGLLFSFYKDGYTLQDRGHHPVHCIPRVKEEDSGIYWCEVATEGSQVQKQSYCTEVTVQGSQVLSTLTVSNSLVAWLPGSLLGVMLIAAALLAYFRPWRKAGSLPSQNQSPAPDEEQCPLHGNAYYQHQKDEEDEGVIYTEVHTTLKRNKARPAEDFSWSQKDVSIVYTEVRCPPLGESSARSSVKEVRPIKTKFLR
ncbi:Fc receptor-like protein 6 [Perognathus longimembris pacificus]|uniref:Fc receptor-like protein 6 n=1 Tax=Perognathus longimembris pacificus TaxID=214514 RepID=UPI00201899E5|nr:Fc receptor-like protein 6 [Perognathus longimembris pacificus]